MGFKNEGNLLYFLLKNTFIAYAITAVPFRLHSTPSCPPPPSHMPHGYFMSMGHAFKFFGFYISYTILTLLLSIFYLPFMLLILCTFPPPTPLLITLHVISISVVLFLFQLFAQFALVFVLCVAVNNCEFAVIFTVHIFYLLFLR